MSSLRGETLQIALEPRRARLLPRVNRHTMYGQHVYRWRVVTLVPGMTAYQRLCHHGILRLADAVLGQRVYSRLDELLRFQWKSIDEIESYRRERLQRLLSFSAARVPFYRTALATRGLAVQDIR